MATQDEVAAHLDLDARSIRNLQKKPGFPVSKGRGGYDLDACRGWYIRYLRDLGRNGQEEESEPEGETIGGINVRYEEARKKQIDADTRSEKLKILRRENAPVEIIQITLAKVSGQLAAKLAALPMKIKMACPDLTPRQVDTMKREIAKAQNECTGIQPDLSDYVIPDPDGDS